MEDLIVIVIMIAISIIGAVTRSKKKKVVSGNMVQSGMQQDKPDFWETLFEDDLPAAEPVFATESFVNAEEPLKVPSKDITPEPILFEEGSPKRMDEIKEDEIKTGEIGNQETSSKILDGFSLKKAVVFSEIINPKYF